MAPPHLDGVLGQVELVGEFAPLGPRDVILLEELLLQPPDLLPAEGRPVPAGDRCLAVAVAVAVAVVWL